MSKKTFEPELCDNCGEPRVWGVAGDQRPRICKQLHKIHINICQVVSIHKFCSEKCKLEWVHSNPKSRPNDFEYIPKSLRGGAEC